eukprot:PITA_14646
MFNSGIVSPPREQIKTIRARLEQFGEVQDTNVFYWFQNRKSKMKRRQRQLQAALRYNSSTETGTPSSSLSMSTPSTSDPSKPMTDLSNSPPANAMHNNIEGQHCSSAVLNSSFAGQQYNGQVVYDERSNYNDLVNVQAIGEKVAEGAQRFLNQGKENVQDSTVNSNPYVITVFVDDRPIVVPLGPINFSAFFGDNLLFDSSGRLVLVNEWGVIQEDMKALVSRDLLKVARTKPSLHLEI